MQATSSLARLVADVGKVSAQLVELGLDPLPGLAIMKVLIKKHWEALHVGLTGVEAQETLEGDPCLEKQEKGGK